MSLKTNELPIVPITDKLSAVVDTDSAGTARISVPDMRDQIGEYFFGANQYKGKSIGGSWASLAEKIKAGNFTNIHIGDYKTISFNGYTVTMEVAGIDTYYKCGDTSIGHHIDFISRECLKTGFKANDTATNQGKATETENPFIASGIHDKLNDDATTISKLPTELKDLIITKRALVENRYTSGSQLKNSKGWDWRDMGRIWLPTEREVFGDSIWGEQSWSGGGGCNIQYPIFGCNVNRAMKKIVGGKTPVAWWTASACAGDATKFVIVDKTGSSDRKEANSTGVYAPLCFRIGTSPN